MNPELNPRLRFVASVSLFALIALCVAWETVVAPVRPGGSWMLLKALPLAFPLRGIVRGNLYTYQWAAMLSLLYLMEGVVRAMSDPAPLSVLMAWGEIILSTTFFLSAIFYVRPAKRAARSETSANVRRPSAASTASLSGKRGSEPLSRSGTSAPLELRSFMRT